MSSYLDITKDNPSLYYGVYREESLGMTRDKSPRFFKELSHILSLYFNKEVKVISEIINMNKIDELNYLNRTKELDFILKTVWTCVMSSEKMCMDCKPCFHRILAIYNAGFEKYLDKDWYKILYKSSPYKQYSDNIKKYGIVRKKEVEYFLKLIKDKNEGI